ncbi:MAG TPA: DUF1206 domain-containing protein, partial [Streptosporangiaceae bacterium]
FMAWSSITKKFLEKLNTAAMSHRTLQVVTWLGRVGGVARGTIFVTAGVFLIIAAAEVKPQQAKGIDSALRALTRTPLGPWLLLVVAIGLVLFGAFSCCEARWRKVQPGHSSPRADGPTDGPADGPPDGPADAQPSR